MPDVLDEITRKLLRVEQPQKGEARIDARKHEVRVDGVPVDKGDPTGVSARREDARDGSPGSDFCAGFPRGACDRVGNRAGPSTREPPRAKRSVDLAHVVMKEYVRRA